MLNSRKINQIRLLPDGDSIALMWIFLLCLAGQINDNGKIYFTSEIPYTDEMLAREFRMEVNTVRLALKTFQQFGMIEIIDEIILLDAWGKWQEVEKLTEIREQTRKRVAKHREKQKLLATSNVTGNVTVTQSNATEEDKELEEDKKKRKKEKPPAPEKHKYGEFKNVLLTEDELRKLKEKFPNDWEKKIEALSYGISSKGYKYSSHYSTILNWARRDEEKKKEKSTPKSTDYGKPEDLYD